MKIDKKKIINELLKIISTAIILIGLCTIFGMIIQYYCDEECMSSISDTSDSTLYVMDKLWGTIALVCVLSIIIVVSYTDHYAAMFAGAWGGHHCGIIAELFCPTCWKIRVEECWKTIKKTRRVKK